MWSPGEQAAGGGGQAGGDGYDNHGRQTHLVGIRCHTSCPMKPLLIIAPSPARWPAVEALLSHLGEPWLDDLRRRLVDGIADGNDAFALAPDGGHALAHACIRRRHDIGVLGHLFTHADHRRRGCARLLLQTLLSWFDMTGGKWLYLTSPAELAESLFDKFGFKVLRRHGTEAQERVAMLRTPVRSVENPFEGLDDRQEIRDVSLADWALLVALLQHRPGPDPRVGLEESALAAETTALELITQQRRGGCRLKVAWRRQRIVGLGSVATDQDGKRTYAMLMPHDRPPEGMRAALLEFARARGYEQVDFPMEALAAAPEPTTPGGQSELPSE